VVIDAPLRAPDSPLLVQGDAGRLAPVRALAWDCLCFAAPPATDFPLLLQAAMIPVTLQRMDPTKHVSRFYRLDVQPVLCQKVCRDCLKGWPLT
jgi:hypothetical protein